jgi:hypothetical protein
MRAIARARFNDFALRAPRRVPLGRYEAFIDGISEAVCAAWGQWQSVATLSGVTIDGAVASGGRVLGPAWAPLILARAPKESQWARKRSAVIATTLGEAWMAYLASIRVPSLEWYPSPASAANVPTPLESLSQASGCLNTMSLLTRMAMALGRRRSALDVEMLESVAVAFVQCFRAWHASTMVTGVTTDGEVASMKPGGFR